LFYSPCKSRPDSYRGYCPVRTGWEPRIGGIKVGRCQILSRSPSSIDEGLLVFWRGVVDVINPTTGCYLFNAAARPSVTYPHGFDKV
jgi:hypothetical protein